VDFIRSSLPKKKKRSRASMEKQKKKRKEKGVKNTSRPSRQGKEKKKRVANEKRKRRGEKDRRVPLFLPEKKNVAKEGQKKKGGEKPFLQPSFLADYVAEREALISLQKKRGREVAHQEKERKKRDLPALSMKKEGMVGTRGKIKEGKRRSLPFSAYGLRKGKKKKKVN